MTNQKLREALAEWDRLKAPFGSTERPTSLDLVIDGRVQALEKIIAAAREVAGADEPRCCETEKGDDRKS